MTTVTLTRLNYQYGKNATRNFVLHDVSLTVSSGELMAVLGPSGCGKTTLLRLIAGLQHPIAGDILFDGASVKKLSAKKRGVMMVFQDEQLFPHMTVFQNVAFGLKSQHVRGKTLHQRVLEALETVQMRGYEKRLPNELSGGEQQRVALARAIAIRPRVLLLDEPLSHLDSNLREQLREMIRDIQQKLKITMVLVTHDQAEALNIADRVAVLYDGKLQQVARPDVILQCPANATIAHFLGMPNIMRGQQQDTCIRTAFGTLQVPSSPNGYFGDVTIIIPTTAVMLQPDTISNNHFIAKVNGYKRQGHLLRYALQIGETIIYMDTLHRCPPNEHLHVYITPEQIQVLS